MILLLILFPLVTNAVGIPKKIYALAGRKYPAVEIQSNIWVSEGCDGKCSAFRAYEKLRNTRITIDRKAHSVNPGAWICKNKAHGRVFIAVDERRNQQSFCLFDDASYINSGAFQVKEK